jgi:hypothetical protein
VKPGRKEKTMSKSPTRQRTDRSPAWLAVARGFYGSAFETSGQAELAEAMTDWTEMSEAERGFVQTHLLYLGLLAQRGTQRMLAQLRQTLGELGDEALELLEAALEDEEEPEDVDEDEDEDEPEDDHDPGLADLDEVEVAEEEEPDAEEEPPTRKLELVRDEPPADEDGDAPDPEAS